MRRTYVVSIAEARLQVGSQLEDVLCSLKQVGIIESFEFTGEDVVIWESSERRLDVFFYSMDETEFEPNLQRGKNGKKE